MKIKVNDVAIFGDNSDNSDYDEIDASDHNRRRLITLRRQMKKIKML